MKREKMLQICKSLHLITLIIGLLTIILPLIFWSKIPETIAIHYGISGKVDNYADKSSLILLFFVIAMLIGVMNIAIYYVKSNATSKYAKEAEKSMLDNVYPMIVFMNLSIQVMFAYMMFCCTTSRQLGGWFAPVFLSFTFAPIVFFSVRRKNGVKEQTNTSQGQKKEEIGIVYRSKVDWWLALILIGAVVMMVWGTLEPIVKTGRVDWTITITTVFVLILLSSLVAIKYVLYTDCLYISCGLFGKTVIPYSEIRSMKETHNPLSSAAMSLDRIQIDYMKNGAHEIVLISPMRKKEFLDKIEAYRKTVHKENESD